MDGDENDDRQGPRASDVATAHRLLAVHVPITEFGNPRRLCASVTCPWGMPHPCGPARWARSVLAEAAAFGVIDA